MINLNHEKIFKKWDNSSYGNDEVKNSIAYNYDINCNDPELQIWFMDKEDKLIHKEELSLGNFHLYSLQIRNPIQNFTKKQLLKNNVKYLEKSKSDEGYQMLWIATNDYNELVKFLEKYYSHTLNKED